MVYVLLCTSTIVLNIYTGLVFCKHDIHGGTYWKGASYITTHVDMLSVRNCYTFPGIYVTTV